MRVQAFCIKFREKTWTIASAIASLSHPLRMILSGTDVALLSTYGGASASQRPVFSISGKKSNNLCGIDGLFSSRQQGASIRQSRELGQTVELARFQQGFPLPTQMPG